MAGSQFPPCHHITSHHASHGAGMGTREVQGRWISESGRIAILGSAFGGTKWYVAGVRNSPTTEDRQDMEGLLGAVVMTMSHKINPPALTWPKVSAGRVCQTIVRPSPVAFVPPAMPT